MSPDKIFESIKLFFREKDKLVKLELYRDIEARLIKMFDGDESNYREIIKHMVCDLVHD